MSEAPILSPSVVDQWFSAIQERQRSVVELHLARAALIEKEQAVAQALAKEDAAKKAFEYTQYRPRTAQWPY